MKIAASVPDTLKYHLTHPTLSTLHYPQCAHPVAEAGSAESLPFPIPPKTLHNPIEKSLTWDGKIDIGSNSLMIKSNTPNFLTVASRVK